jgi:hypothetical protein
VAAATKVSNEIATSQLFDGAALELATVTGSTASALLAALTVAV